MNSVQLWTGIILVTVGMTAYSHRAVRGEIWNGIAVALVGTGGYALVDLIPSNRFVGKEVLFVILGIIVCVLIIKMDGQITTIIGIVMLIVLAVVGWNYLPESWKDWLNYVWNLFLEFSRMLLGKIGITF